MTSLSPRQVEVLRLVAEGMSNDEIAEAASLHVKTVEHYLEITYQKLGFFDLTNAGKRVKAAVSLVKGEIR